MKMIEKKLKQSNYESIFVSCVTIILGIIMIIFYKNFLNFISYLLGGALIVNGILKIYYYLKYEGKYNIFNYDLSFGILNIIFGVICIIFKSELQSIFRIVIGVIISFASKIFSVDKVSGIIGLLLSILMILAGLIIISTKGVLTASTGYILIAFAIINIIESIIFNKNLNKLKKYLDKFNNK